MNHQDWIPRPGDLVWLNFSPTKGTEQAGHRPALVVSNTRSNQLSGRVLVMPVSSRVRRWPTEVPLPKIDGIAGVIITDQVRTINWRARDAKPAVRVPPAVLDSARDKLAALIERD